MIYLLLVLSVVLAVATVLVARPKKNDNLKLLIAFSGSYLLSITSLHLIPEVFRQGQDGYPGAFILAGFFIQVLLEYLSGGIEHGHTHSGSKRVIPWGIMIGLYLHAFLEGTPLGVGVHAHGTTEEAPGTSNGSSTGGIESALLWGIVLHKYPVAMVLLSMLLNAGLKLKSSLLLLSGFAAMAPLGALLGGTEVLGGYHRELLAVVIGIFLHVSTTILFESSEGHRFNFLKFLAILAGIVLGGLGLWIH